MSKIWLGLCVALLVGSSPATAQHTRAQPSRGVKGAVEKLVEHREQLGLTADQLTRLQEIRARTEAENGPLQQQMMTLWHEWKARREAEPDMPEAEQQALRERTVGAVRRLQEQIHHNEHEAGRAVGRVLTPEQKKMLCDIVDCRKRGGDRDNGPGERGSRRD
jgi:hypothetical protein